MDGWKDGWMDGRQRALNLAYVVPVMPSQLSFKITSFSVQNTHFVSISKLFPLRCAIVSISLLGVFEMKSVREILKSKFSTETCSCGKGLSLRSYMCCLPDFTSNPAALPLPLSAFQLLKLMKC